MKETLGENNAEHPGYLFSNPDTFATAPELRVFIIADDRTENISNKAQRNKNSLVKRGLDVVISILVIIFILPWVFPLLSILIKLESKGPILFKQLRSGCNNKPFWCYKFRTMVPNDQSDLVQATRGDARITKIGRFLRKSSMDELPQFFNVLKGDMSVVGPRPHMPKLDEFYSPKINKYMDRLMIKQGLTGWAQINGFRGETNDIYFMEKRIEHDIWYIENWSVWLDIKIIFSTLFLVFKDDQSAY